MTAGPFSIRSNHSDPLATLAGEIVASLPLSYLLGGADATIAPVDGTSADWIDVVRARLETSARVVVVDPVVVGSTELVALHAEAAERVAISESWAGNPAVAAVRDAWAADLDAAVLVEVAIREPTRGASRVDLILRGVRVLQALGVPSVRLGAPTGNDRGFAATGRTPTGVVVTIFAVRTDAGQPGCSVTAFGPESTVQLQLPPATTARPARARRVTGESASALPTIWQTAHRSTFQRLHGLLERGETVDELESFAVAVRSALDSPSVR